MTMTMIVRPLLLSLLLLGVAQQQFVAAFAPSSTSNAAALQQLQQQHTKHTRNNKTPMTMGLRSTLPTLASSMSLPKQLSGLFSANGSTTSTTTTDPVMREFEKKEAAFLKRREDAAKRLSAYEQSLEELQNKKAEYMAGTQLAEPPVGGSFSETALRSVVKSFCWRIVAGSVTFATTLRFSGSVTQALQVVGADFFSKAFTMFIGERLMNKSQAGRKKGGDGASRSLAKALIWRVFAICNTLTMAIFISKDLSVASKIASTDAVFKTALMFFYERVWARIGWGKEYLIEFSI